jgi:hypothetical protein
MNQTDFLNILDVMISLLNSRVKNESKGLIRIRYKDMELISQNVLYGLYWRMCWSGVCGGLQ